jgi:hypothetical protein
MLRPLQSFPRTSNGPSCGEVPFFKEGPSCSRKPAAWRHQLVDRLAGGLLSRFAGWRGSKVHAGHTNYLWDTGYTGSCDRPNPTTQVHSTPTGSRFECAGQGAGSQPSHPPTIPPWLAQDAILSTHANDKSNGPDPTQSPHAAIDAWPWTIHPPSMDGISVEAIMVAIHRGRRLLLRLDCNTKSRQSSRQVPGYLRLHSHDVKV